MPLTSTTYSTYTSVLTMLPNLPQTTTTSGYTVTGELICAHLGRAYNLINTKLARRFATPFTLTNIPPMCASLNEDLACYYSMRSLYTRDAQNNSEWVVEHYDKAIKVLDELADVKNGLDMLDASGALVGERVSATGKIQTTTDYPPVFELDEETNWKVSDDRLDDVETWRDE